MREKLMASIRLAIENSQAIDIEARSADDLLAELVGTGNQDDDVARDDKNLDDVDGETSLKEVADPSQKADLEDPRGGESQILALAREPDLHSIPLTQSPPKSTEPRENPASP
jgi:hypothetical protein